MGDQRATAGASVRVHVYPPSGTSAEDGHSFCAGGEHPPWGDEVLAFLGEAMGGYAGRAPH